MHRGLICLALLVPLACGDDLEGDSAVTLGGSGSTDDATSEGSTATGSATAPTTSGDSTTTGTPATTGEPTTTAATTLGTTGSTGEPDTTTGGLGEFLRCHDPPPPGAKLAPEIPPYGGTCPVLEVGYMDGQAY
ncbi:MAG TPA: hypothetical protein VIK91_22705, partial [Nannocystis sp.]